ncbi:hypothetical protein QBC35DRAFT_530096 [Podospora australis]|uniref:Uncharacterized protein n=1 Tax=Podospora australis TaxID=1536484 RepID=A0AAN6WZ08_9PEZI|nr:hypothetical protein QBC35DRAFT_530096 [Podospora australis]
MSDNEGSPMRLASKQVRWNDSAHQALIVALAEVIKAELSKGIVHHKDQIITSLNSQGFDFTWEAVRQVLFSPSSSELRICNPRLLDSALAPIVGQPSATICSSESNIILQHNNKMPRWTPEVYLDLLVSMFGAVNLDEEARNTVIAEMAARGHEGITWNQVRNFPATPTFTLHQHQTSQLSTPRAVAMPRPALTNRWEHIRDDLFEVVYSTIGPVPKDKQAEIVRTMRKRGFNIGWNSIR